MHFAVWFVALRSEPVPALRDAGRRNDKGKELWMKNEKGHAGKKSHWNELTPICVARHDCPDTHLASRCTVRL